MSGVANLVELSLWRAEEHASRPAYTFLLEGETEAGTLTWRDVDSAAKAVAVQLSAMGGRSTVGERALLLFPPGLDFITAFFGCLYAGVVAVPAYPPRTSREDP